MSQVKLLFILTVYLLNEIEAPHTTRSYVHQKDLSEYCRRRVMPSVFIGNQVVEAHSKILHFSQLEVPYSCYVSIRSELGSNIILVLEIMHDEDFCANNNSPVKVFEMGETFGGYWGYLPDSLVANTVPYTEKYYTLRSSPSPDYTDYTEPELNDYSTDVPSKTPAQVYTTEDDYEVEIPLLNVSGILVPDTVTSTHHNPFSIDDTFDIIYDVAQKPGVSYDTTIIPIVQFAIQAGPKENVARSNGTLSGNGTADNGDGLSSEPRYLLDYKLGEYTLDPRLTFSFNTQKIKNRNRRLRFKKRKNKAHKHFFKSGQTKTPYGKPISKLKASDIWPRLEDILKNLTRNESEELKSQKALEAEKFSALVQKLDGWQHNYSAYLAPNLFDADKHPSYLDKILLESYQNTSPISASVIRPTQFEITALNATEKSMKTSSSETESVITNIITSTTQHLNAGDLVMPLGTTIHNKEFIDTESTSTVKPLETSETLTTTAITGTTKLVTDVTKSTVEKITNVANWASETLYSLKTATTNKNRDTESIIKQKTESASPIIDTSPYLKTLPNRLTISSSIMSAIPVTGASSNHAIGERTTAVTQTNKMQKSTTTKPGIRRRRKRRKKRAIQQIVIDLAKPHNLTTRAEVVTTSEAVYRISGVQDFARLVELREDEMHGHIPLLYMRRYVGAKLFDVCSNSSAVKHVYLFNTSRIVIAITNFTLKRMVMIATPARTLTRSNMFCSNATLECQVSGARVCVDNITACDGIPHCGTYEIYDEDRLLCGRARDLQHNVYLAAFTLLMVLLTMAYTVHYWLKRCVPKVSEAFFIYTDGFENKLHLQSIMKPPIDTGYTYSATNQKTDLFFGLQTTARSYKFNLSAFKNIFKCCRRKKKDDFEMFNLNFTDGNARYSFPEIEIGNLSRIQVGMVDEGVQTGESLEMENISEVLGMVSYQDSLLTTKFPEEVIQSKEGFPDLRLSMTAEEAARRSSEDSELLALKFLRARATSIQVPEQSDLFEQQTGPEKHIGSIVYDPLLFPYSSISPTPSLIRPESDLGTMNDDQPGTSELRAKRLRFEDNVNPNDGDEEGNARGSTVLEPDQENTGGGAGGAARDFMRFWGSKTRKPKKRSIIP